MTDLITMKEDILNNAKKILSILGGMRYLSILMWTKVHCDSYSRYYNIDHQYTTTSVLTVTYLAGEIFTFKN